MTWGLAEEAGFAVRWLEERGAPGAAALAGYLVQRQSYSTKTCPIAVGASVSDSGTWKNTFPLRLYQPVLVLPFLASVLDKEFVMLTWVDHRAIVNSSGICSVISDESLCAGSHVCLVEETVNFPALSERHLRVPDERQQHVTTLGKIAHRIYAPATEESRAKGAGDGLTDND